MNPDRPAERPTTGRGLSVSGIAAVVRHESRRKAAGQLVLAVFTVAVVVGTLWLLGALNLAARLVGLEQPWLQSPIGIGS